MAFNPRRAAIRALLSLPTPVLRGLSGGGVVHVEGRTLDPRLQFLASQARANPPMSSLTPEQARAGSAAGLAALAGALEPGVRSHDLDIPRADAPPIPARAYRTEDQNPAAPLLVFGHFGGGVIGDLETCHQFCGILARIARCPVLSVDYALAPEHRFPAGLDDMLTAWRWARRNAQTFGAPADHVAIGGDSMGGNFAAVIAQEARRTGEPAPALQLLIYPAVDLGSESPSMTTHSEDFPLTRDTMDWFMGHYMGPADSPTDPRLSPLLTRDLSGLAPAVVITAGFDPLRDQGEDYAKRLKAAGVSVTYRCYDTLCHGFTAFVDVVPAADAACREIATLVRDAFAAG